MHLLDDSPELVPLARQLDEAAFAKRFPGLFLIVRDDGLEPLPDAAIRTTRRVPRPDAPPAPAGAGRPFRIISVVRRGSGPFSDLVSLGREATNDVVLPHTTVSKLHACFAESEPGVWTLTDQGSTNGTFVNGARLTPQVPRKLGPSQTVAFGQVHVGLKHGAALWRFLGLEQRAQ